MTLALFFAGVASGQGFVETVEEGGMSAMYGNECVVTFQSGEEITGKVCRWGLCDKWFDQKSR